MKNLKRVLSLVLATVMVIGMMVVGASAANYTDADKIDYTEAVDVMTAVGMISGIGNDEFAPTATIDRAGATKLITYLMLGTDVASKLTVTDAPFEDVSANAWYAPFVAFCAEKGLLEGYNGKFNPNGTIDAYGFAKLLLGALGYDAKIEGLTGDVWQVNTATLAIKNDLFNGNEGALNGKPMTREEACLYAFNALKATTVEYASKGTDITLPGGGSITTGASKAEPVPAGNVAGYDGVRDRELQLCEALYPSLKMTAVGNCGSDSFGRPGYSWTFGKNADVVTFVADDALAVYAGEDFKATVVTKTYKGYDFDNATITYNGGSDASLTNAASVYGIKGATVELYADDNKDITDIVVIEGYVTEVSKVETVKKSDEIKVTLKVYEAGYIMQNTGNPATVVVSSESNEDAYALVENYEKGDVFMGFWYPGWNTQGGGADTLLAVDELETISGEITAAQIKMNNTTPVYSQSWIKVDGEKYNFASEYSRKAVKVEDEGTFYLYNGYVVHYAVENPADTSDQVAYFVRAGEQKDMWNKTTYYAELVFTDGTTKVVETPTKWTDNAKIVRYTVEDDVYTLTGGGATGLTSPKITKGVSKLATNAWANDSTVYIICTLKADGTVKSVQTYTGFKNVPSMDIKDGRAVMNEDASTIADFVFATYVSAGSTDAASLIFVDQASKSGLINDKDLGKYYTYTAVVDGELTTIMVKDGVTVDQYLFSGSSIDKNGVYTALTKANGTTDHKTGVNFTGNNGGVVTIGSDTYAFAEDMPIYVIENTADGVFEGSVDEDYTGTVYYTVKDEVVTSVYVVPTQNP